jgi:hypothetical protein
MKTGMLFTIPLACDWIHEQWGVKVTFDEMDATVLFMQSRSNEILHEGYDEYGYSTYMVWREE